MDFCNIVATFFQQFATLLRHLPAVRARSAAEVEAAKGGEASPPSSAWVGFSVFAPRLARPTTSTEVRRIYRLPPLPPTSNLDAWMPGCLDFYRCLAIVLDE